MSATPGRGRPARAAGTGAVGRPGRSAAGAALAPASPESAIAAEIKALVLAGEKERARDRFGELVALQQRRAVRIAYAYLRDAYDVDEAVQDAFVKVFTHITGYREEYPFEVWFTRILVNGCLDLRKSRARRLRWVLPMAGPSEQAAPVEPVARQRSAEDNLISSERASHITAAIERLPARQRTVFTLCHVADQSTSEVSRALGLSEATVRVHLFRAVRKLRVLLGDGPSAAFGAPGAAPHAAAPARTAV